MTLEVDVSGLERELGGEIGFKVAGPAPVEAGSGGQRWGPVKVEGRAIWTGSTVLVLGRASATAELTCSRCLDDYTLPVSAEFSQEYRLADSGSGPPQPDDPQGTGRDRRDTGRTATRRSGGPTPGDPASPEDAATDEEPLPFSGDTIDLAGPVWESLLLELPMKPVCDERCPGLCPVCGAKHGETTCGCRVETADPRLMSLKTLLETKERGD